MEGRAAMRSNCVSRSPAVKQQACEVLAFGIANGTEWGRHASIDRLDVCPAVEKERHCLSLLVVNGRVQGGPA